MVARTPRWWTLHCWAPQCIQTRSPSCHTGTCCTCSFWAWTLPPHFGMAASSWCPWSRTSCPLTCRSRHSCRYDEHKDCGIVSMVRVCADAALLCAVPCYGVVWCVLRACCAMLGCDVVWCGAMWCGMLCCLGKYGCCFAVKQMRCSHAMQHSKEPCRHGLCAVLTSLPQGQCRCAQHALNCSRIVLCRGKAQTRGCFARGVSLQLTILGHLANLVTQQHDNDNNPHSRVIILILILVAGHQLVLVDALALLQSLVPQCCCLNRAVIPCLH